MSLLGHQGKKHRWQKEKPINNPLLMQTHERNRPRGGLIYEDRDRRATTTRSKPLNLCFLKLARSDTGIFALFVYTTSDNWLEVDIPNPVQYVNKLYNI